MGRAKPENIAKKQTLALLYTAVEEAGGAPFTFKIGGCVCIRLPRAYLTKFGSIVR